jgi:hypothetical protein
MIADRAVTTTSRERDTSLPLGGLDSEFLCPASRMQGTPAGGGGGERNEDLVHATNQNSRPIPLLNGSSALRRRVSSSASPAEAPAAENDEQDDDKDDPSGGAHDSSLRLRESRNQIYQRDRGVRDRPFLPDSSDHIGS